MSTASEIEECAARWLIRHEESAWSPGDQAELDAWLDQSMAHKAAYWRLEHGWREADRISALGPQDNSGGQWYRPSWATSWKPFAIAASLLAIISLGGTWSIESERAPVVQASFDTAVGGHKVIALADDSKIELNTASEVRTAVTKEKREVWLDRGEAYFEVAHSLTHPFVVHAGSHTITVLGTKFSVRRDGDKVTVAVVEGRVRIEGDEITEQKRSATITGGDVAIVQGVSTLVSANAAKRVESELAWRDGMLDFDQFTLAQAAAEFNRYNQRKIIITDPQAAQILIGGTFQASNVDAFVRLLSDAYGLRIETHGDEVKISI